MKVKIGETVYDSSEQPIAIFLSKEERRQIADMSPDCIGIYSQFPEGRYSVEEMTRWVDKLISENCFRDKDKK
jgi:hypothetical protein